MPDSFTWFPRKVEGESSYAYCMRQIMWNMLFDSEIEFGNPNKI